MEEWIDIQDYEGLYQVSDKARVRSLDRSVNGFRGIKIKKSKILKQQIIQGYYKVWFSKNNEVKSFFVHVLFGVAFIPNPNNYPVLNHIDGIKLNISKQNLEWCTISDNLKHAFRTGLNSNKGERHSQSILTDDLVREIRQMAVNSKPADIATHFNLQYATVYSVIKNLRWKHVKPINLFTDHIKTNQPLC